MAEGNWRVMMISASSHLGWLFARCGDLEPSGNLF